MHRSKQKQKNLIYSHPSLNNAHIKKMGFLVFSFNLYFFSVCGFLHLKFQNLNLKFIEALKSVLKTNLFSIQIQL